MRGRTSIVFVVDFFLEGLGDVDFFAGDDIGEIVVEGVEGGLRRGVFETDDQEVAHPAGGMEIPVEARDPFHGLLGVISGLVKVQVVRRNEMVAEEMFSDVFVPGFPVSATGRLHENERHDLAFAGLHKGEGFVAFVHGAETAREQDERVGMSDESELAGEEILKGHELLVPGHDRIGGLFPGQANIRAETHIDTSAFVAGLHDARTSPGDYHVAGLGDLSRELDGLKILGLRWEECEPSRKW
jgi:hypothetical protein